MAIKKTKTSSAPAKASKTTRTAKTAKTSKTPKISRAAAKRPAAKAAKAAAKPRTATTAKRTATAKPAKSGNGAKVAATPKGTSDKDHLVTVIQGQTGAPKAAAKEALDAVMQTVMASLKKNQKVQLLGFGTFEVAKRKARTGRNPATGESIRIKASKTVRFKAGTRLRAAV